MFATDRQSEMCLPDAICLRESERKQHHLSMRAPLTKMPCSRNLARHKTSY